MTTPTLSDSLEGLILSAAEAVRPPERLTVSEAAQKYRYIINPGNYVGPWDNNITPYLIEPMDLLQSLDYSGVVFVGSVQCGKTEVFNSWLTYTAICDQADMMLVQSSQTDASDFSKRRIDKLHQQSPPVRDRLMPGMHSDAIYMKRYRGGMILSVGWPSINVLSGKPIPRMFLTDYDRMDQDVDANGDPFNLAQARTTTFGRYGMTVAESTPSFPVNDANWVRQSAHEAPPTEGILSLYNAGDRRRWYWQCSNCRNWFEPDFHLLRWPETNDFLAAGEQAWLECPHCAHKHTHNASDQSPGKREMNKNGKWLRDGESITAAGEVTGTGSRSETASFWLKGVAASFQSWTKVVAKYLAAHEHFRRTGSESKLKTTTNLQQGLPYTPKSMESERLPEQLKQRAIEIGHKVVPHGVRFLIAAVDVQKNRFVVQVHGIGEYGDMWIVDRFDVKYSRRLAEDREGQFLWVNPFAYAEDWRLLLNEVILKTYPLGDGSGREMSIKATFCDSGGAGEGTANSYKFWRWLKHGPQENDPDAGDWPEWVPGLHQRFQLVKGASTKITSRVKPGFPDSQRKDRAAGARGEIPVLWINTNAVKNQVDQRLARTDPGGGVVTFPKWLDINFYKELCVETKNHKGEWENPKGYRNESWDLMVYAEAGLISPQHVGIEQINWDNPPEWAEDWDANILVFNPQTDAKPFDNDRKPRYDLSDLAARLG